MCGGEGCGGGQVRISASQLHGLVSSQDVKVDSVVSGGVGGGQGGRLVPPLLVWRTLYCDDSGNRKLLETNLMREHSWPDSCDKVAVSLY